MKNRFEIWADDFFYPADRCIMHELIYLDRLSFPIEANRFYCGIHAYPVTELETVGQRLLGIVYSNVYIIEFMDFNAFRKCLSAEAIGPDRRMVQTGFLRPARQCHMDFVGNLCGEFMIRQR